MSKRHLTAAVLAAVSGLLAPGSTLAVARPLVEPGSTLAVARPLAAGRPLVAARLSAALQPTPPPQNPFLTFDRAGQIVSVCPSAAAPPHRWWLFVP